MATNKYKKLVTDLLSKANIQINGSRVWDIKINNENFYRRILKQGSLGLGESYMDSWWECQQIDEFINRLVRADIKKKVQYNWVTAKTYLQTKLFNPQSLKGSTEVIHKHYDISNELYLSFLDPYNQYTCGYFKGTDNLNEAQEKKLQLICSKLQLTKTDKVLDIGCGWGGFAKFAAERHGCHVTGVTISKEQAAYARQFTKNLPVTIIEKDYRAIEGKFDKILICGMIEHVGNKNYRKIFEIVNNALTENGLFLLHTIGSKTTHSLPDPWIDKYIFPNGVLPTLKQLIIACDKLFIVEDLHNFGAYYDHTLMAWYKNFDNNWENLKDNFDERFYRMWKYYLLMCAGLFRARETELWQIVLSKNGVINGYNSIR